MALKPEPLDVEAAPQGLFTTNAIEAPSSMKVSSAQDDAPKSTVGTRHTLNTAASHPVNFLTGHSGQGVTLDPGQEDVLLLSSHVTAASELRRDLAAMRQVTEYANYSISHHEAELNSKQLPKKYLCRFCIYKTSYKSDLNRHLRKHGIAPQHCPLCNMPFKTTGNLENHIRQAHADIADGMGILPSSLSTMCVEGALVPPLSLGAMARLVDFPQGGPDVQLARPQHAHVSHVQQQNLQHDFPALSQAVLSPTQLSCHLCPFVCGDSQALARHLLTHPGEEEASRMPRASHSHRVACSNCGMILSSLEELHAHRLSCPSPEDLSQRKEASHEDRANEKADTESLHHQTALQTTEKNGSWHEVIKYRDKTAGKQRETLVTSASQYPANQTCVDIKSKHMVLPHIPVIQTDSQSFKQTQLQTETVRNPNSVPLSDASREESSKMTSRYGDSNKKTSHNSRASADSQLPSQRVFPHRSKAISQQSVDQSDVQDVVSDMQSGGNQNRDTKPRELSEVNSLAAHLTKTRSESASRSAKTSDLDRGEPSSNRWSHCESVDKTNTRTLPAKGEDLSHTEHTSSTELSPNYSKEAANPQSGSPTSLQLVSQRSILHDDASMTGKQRHRQNLGEWKAGSSRRSGDAEEDEPSRMYGGLVTSCSKRKRSSTTFCSFHDGHRDCVLCGQQFGNRSHLATHLQLDHALAAHVESCVGGSTGPSSSVHRQATGSQKDGQPSTGIVTWDSEKLESGEIPHGRAARASIPWESSARAQLVSSQPMSQAGNTRTTTTSDRLSQGRDKVAAEQLFPTPAKRPRDDRVVSQPPSSGRYARLVSDFDEFSCRPYACSLCFFRTSSLSELAVHAHNHLTGCSVMPVPDTARFQSRGSLHVERATSPTRPDCPAFLLSLFSGSSPLSWDFHVGEGARGDGSDGEAPPLDSGQATGSACVHSISVSREASSRDKLSPPASQPSATQLENPSTVFTPSCSGATTACCDNRVQSPGPHREGSGQVERTSPSHSELMSIRLGGTNTDGDQGISVTTTKTGSRHTDCHETDLTESVTTTPVKHLAENSMKNTETAGSRFSNNTQECLCSGEESGQHTTPDPSLAQLCTSGAVLNAAEPESPPDTASLVCVAQWGSPGDPGFSGKRKQAARTIDSLCRVRQERQLGVRNKRHSKGWPHRISRGWTHHLSRGWTHHLSRGWTHHLSRGWTHHLSRSWTHHLSRGWTHRRASWGLPASSEHSSCVQCRKTFSLKALLNRHVRIVHPEPKTA